MYQWSLWRHLVKKWSSTSFDARMSSKDHLLPILPAELSLASWTGIYYLEPVKIPASWDEICSSRKVLFIVFVSAIQYSLACTDTMKRWKLHTIPTHRKWMHKFFFSISSPIFSVCNVFRIDTFLLRWKLFVIFFFQEHFNSCQRFPCTCLQRCGQGNIPRNEVYNTLCKIYTMYIQQRIRSFFNRS